MVLLKILQKRPLLVIMPALVGLVFVFLTIFSQSKSPVVGISVPINKKENVITGLPIRLKIPNINVDASIESVGLNPDGSVGVPKGPAEAAWFELGPRPGQEGSSVIDGHSGWKNGIPAVFDNLNKLRKGDKIYVEDSKGATTTFVVREFRTYSPNEEAPDVFGSSDAMAHLNLITCTGIWNKIAKSHSDRLVAFADKE